MQALTFSRQRIRPTRCLEQNRETLASLFYKSAYPLTGPELRGLLKNRQVRITRQGKNIMMHVLPKQWEVPDMLWDNLALVLNEWNATSVVRDKFPLQMEIAGQDESVCLPLSVLIREFDDWVDHA